MNWKSWVLALTVVAIWSTSALLVSNIVAETDPICAAGIVVLIATILMLFVFLINKDRRKLWKSIHREGIKQLILPAFLGLFLYPIFFFLSMKSTEPAEANVVNYLWPFIAAVYYSMRHENNFRLLDFACTAFAGVGAFIVMFISFRDRNIEFGLKNIGLLYAAAGAACYGIYTGILHKSDSSKEMCSCWEMNLRMLIMSTISLACFLLLLLGMRMFCPDQIKLSESFQTLFRKKDVLYKIVIYAMLNFYLAHMIWNKLNREYPATKTANIAYLIPALSTIVLAYVDKQPLGIPAAVGLVFVFLSLAASNYRRLNSFVFTGSSIIVLLILDYVLPLPSPETKLIDEAKTFLELVIAMFAIYYGFVLNRVVEEGKSYRKTWDKWHYKLLILQKSEHGRKIIQNVTNDFSAKKKEEKWLAVLDQEELKLDQKEREEMYDLCCEITAIPRKALSITEWIVLALLSFVIIVLCGIVRSDEIIIKIVVLSICASACMCMSILIEYEKNLREIRECIIKSTSTS